jgi:serine/threonine-protein phosphatase 2A regulatory subunit B''
LQLISHAKDATFITEQELERFLFERIPELTTQKKLHESFYPYYVFTASRRFFFFLDPHRVRRIGIKKVAHSSVMGELLFLRRISQYEGEVDPASQAQVRS